MSKRKVAGELFVTACWLAALWGLAMLALGVPSITRAQRIDGDTVVYVMFLAFAPIGLLIGGRAWYRWLTKEE